MPAKHFITTTVYARTTSAAWAANRYFGNYATAGGYYVRSPVARGIDFAEASSYGDSVPNVNFTARQRDYCGEQKQN